MKLQEIIKEHRSTYKLSMDELAKRSGLSKAYIGMLESGVNPQTKKPISPSVEVLSKLANAMNISLNDLISNLDNMIVELPSVNNLITNLVSIPIYSPISCGTGLFVDDEIIEYIPLPTEKLSKGKEYFGQYASGDSMINAGIIDGDIIVFEKTNIIETGKIGCFCIDENIATCKRFNKTDSSIILMPANDKHMPIIVDIMSDCFKVIGKLAFVVSDRRDY